MDIDLHCNNQISTNNHFYDINQRNKFGFYFILLYVGEGSWRSVHFVYFLQALYEPYFLTASNKHNLYHEIKSCIFPLLWLLRFFFFFSKLHCLPLSCMHNRFIHRTLLQVSGSVFNFPLWFNKRHVIIASL